VTLLLSLITPHYAMQASDRRVTYLRDGKIAGRDDERNKAIFVAERFTFAITGAADIDGDTVEFVAAQMARNLSEGASPLEALLAVGRMCGQHLAQSGNAENDRLALVGVGWTDTPPAPRSPLMVWTSNSMSADGAWQPRDADAFEVGDRNLAGHDPLALLVSGTGLLPAALEQLKLDLFGAVTAGDDPTPVAEILLRAIRKASQTNPLIGPGVMINNLPFACGSPTGDFMFIGGPPKRDVRTFSYAPASLSASVYLGPHIVGSDGTRMSDFGGQGEPGTFGLMYGSSSPGARRAVVGQRINEAKTGRNSPCWCGSGKKFKKCHGA
jgi:SEC-C motif